MGNLPSPVGEQTQIGVRELGYPLTLDSIPDGCRGINLPSCNGEHEG